MRVILAQGPRRDLIPRPCLSLVLDYMTLQVRAYCLLHMFVHLIMPFGVKLRICCTAHSKWTLNSSTPTYLRDILSTFVEVVYIEADNARLACRSPQFLDLSCFNCQEAIEPPWEWHEWLSWVDVHKCVYIIYIYIGWGCWKVFPEYFLGMDSYVARSAVCDFMFC